LAWGREARKLAPDDADVAYLLGRLATQNGDNSWGYSLLQESAQKQPGNPDVLFDLAHALYAIGRVNDAEDTMRRAVQAASSPPNGARGSDLASPETTRSRAELIQEAQSFLSLVALSRTPEKRLEAEAQVQNVLKARPDYLPALMVAGLIHEQRGRTNEARQVYEQIVSRNPEFAPARRQLAILFANHFNDPQKAFDYANKAREVLTQDPELAKILGKTAYGRKDYRTAVRFLQEASLKRSDDSEIFYLLGKSHRELKEKDESKRALERALALNPNAIFASEVKQVLAELKK
jgi:Flp pilus assembly protein TadD